MPLAPSTAVHGSTISAQLEEPQERSQFNALDSQRLLLILASTILISFAVPHNVDDPLTLTLTWLSFLCIFVGASSIAILYTRLSFLRGVSELQLHVFRSQLGTLQLVLFIPHILTAGAVLFLAMSLGSMTARPCLAGLQPTDSQMFCIRITAACASVGCIVGTLVAPYHIERVFHDCADGAGGDTLNEALSEK